jgi:hypothetical protein
MQRMRRLPGAVALSFVCLLTLLPGGRALAQARHFPDTRDGVFLFYDQLPFSLTPAQTAVAATRFAGCQKVPLSLVQALRSYNAGFIVLNYRLAFGTYDSIAAYLSGNDWVNDWDSTRTHADWFITDPASADPAKRVRQTDWRWFLMDISGAVNGNTTGGWKEYWARSVLQQLRATSSDGVFADSYCFPWNLDVTPGWLAPPADVAWIPHMETFGRYARQQFQSQPERFYLIPNVGPWITTRDTCDYGAFSDGVMVEFFASPGPFDLYDIGDWELEMNRTLDLVRRGKIILCQPITSDEWNIGERLYNLASYLLIKGDATFYNLVFGENFFSRLVWFPECAIPLGPYLETAPADISSLYDAASGCYLRRYAKGLVYVNPTWDGRSVTLDREYFTPDSAAMMANAAVDVAEDGSMPGPCPYRRVSGSVPIPAKGGLLLVTDIADAAESQALPPASPAVEAYPQPCARTVTLRFFVPGSSAGTCGDVTVYSSLGRILYHETLASAVAGWNSVSLTAGQRGYPELPSGLYAVEIRIAPRGQSPLVLHSRISVLR